MTEINSSSRSTDLEERNTKMGDIKSKPLLYLKGLLFVGLGLVASALILIEHQDLRLAFLLVVAIWSFCRAYYFAFYVIEHYIDPDFKFAGLGTVVAYLWRLRRNRSATTKDLNN